MVILLESWINPELNLVRGSDNVGLRAATPSGYHLRRGRTRGLTMAGYMFTLDNIDALHRCVEQGVYATYITDPSGRWGDPAEGTFADYATMCPGDNVYFFIKRRIYGIGELVAVGADCKYQNYPGASQPVPFDDREAETELLIDDGSSRTDTGKTRAARWMCTFRPTPAFFTEGVDMDDALSSDPPAFRILRAIWKLSFIKFDDEENQAFRNALLKLNQAALVAPAKHANVFEQKHEPAHDRIRGLVTLADYRLDSRPLVLAAARDGLLRHEMALEAGILHQLAVRDTDTETALGRWDYLSHQVIASPFKPIDYMDKMDLFGYAYVPGYKPTISRYLVGELKKDEAGTADIEQAMKYVDWVKDEYAHGDYSMIHAVLVASDFPASVVGYADDVASRTFTVQRRPARSAEWSALKLIKYSVDAHGKIRLEEVKRTRDQLTRI